MISEWWDKDHTHWVAMDAGVGYECDKCDNGTRAVVEAEGRDDYDGCAWLPLCQAHYDEMRADPHHNPTGGFADRYVSLGAALR